MHVYFLCWPIWGESGTQSIEPLKRCGFGGPPGPKLSLRLGLGDARHEVVVCKLCGALGSDTRMHLATCLVVRSTIEQLFQLALDPDTGPTLSDFSRLVDGDFVDSAGP